MGLFRRDAERYVAVWQSRTGSVRSNKARFGMAVKDRSGMIGYGVITHERSLYESNNG